MRMLLTLALLIPIAACGDRRETEVDFGEDDLGPDRYSVLSEEGDVRMALTDRFVYFALSDSVVAEARAELEQDSAREGLGQIFGGIIETAVGKALGFRAKIPVEEIRDIRWEAGEMRIEFVDPDREMGRSFQVDDQPVSEAFDRESVEAFADAFRRLKDERGGQEGAGEPAPGS